MTSLIPKSGWIADYPELESKLAGFRYLYNDDDEVKVLLREANEAKKNSPQQSNTLPEEPELLDEIRHNFFSDVKDQEDLYSCTAHVVVALLEYFRIKAEGQLIELSRLYLYKRARELMKEQGEEDSGVPLAAAIQAFLDSGTPKERDYPYDPEKLNDPIPPELDDAAQLKVKIYKYRLHASFFRIDSVDINNQKGFEEKLLSLIKKYLQACFPLGFGFRTSQSCIEQSKINGGYIPFPSPTDSDGEKLDFYHAVIAVGYDNQRGALIIRNSWGKTWGDTGYGYLPYEYVQKGFTKDWWTVIEGDWATTGKFGLVSGDIDDLGRPIGMAHP